MRNISNQKRHQQEKFWSIFWERQNNPKATIHQGRCLSAKNQWANQRHKGFHDSAIHRHRKSIGNKYWRLFLQDTSQLWSLCLPDRKRTDKTPGLVKIQHGIILGHENRKINWIKNKEWVIQRIFEYGNSQEIGEGIRFYGKETIQAVLQGTHSKWKKKQEKEILKNLYNETS